MKSAKRFITACLTATMIFQALAPSTEVLAQEMNAANDAAVQAAFALDGAVKGAKSRAAQFASDAGKAVAADSTSSSDNASQGDEATDNTGSSDTTNGSASTGDAEQPAGDEPGESTPSAGDDAASSDDATADDTTKDNADDQTDGNAEAEKAATGAAIATADDLKKSVENTGGTSHGTVTVEGDKVTNVVFNDAEALILISNTDPQIYQNATIVRSGTTGGGIDVTGESGDYTFQGFGSEDTPFAGKLDMNGVTLTVARTLYNGLSLTGDNGTVAVAWKGTGSDPIVAKKLVGNGKSLDATVTIADSGDANPDENNPGITGALLGSVQGDVALDAKYGFSGTRKGIGIKSTTDNAGLLVNTLESGKLTLKSLSGTDGAKGTPTITTSAANAAAGGLIGCVNDNASVEVAGTLGVSNLTVTATGSEGAAGGFIGRAKNFTLTFGKDASVKPALKVGDANTTYAGGTIGDVSFAGADAGTVTIEPGKFDFVNETVVLGAKKRAGGLFGRLDLTNGDVTVKGGTYKSKLTAGADSDGNRGSYGGIAGNVCSTASDDAIHALNVEKNDNDKAQIEIERAASLCYVGGIAGYQGDDSATQKTAIVLDGAQVQINGAAYAYTGNGKLGGAVGVVDTDQLLDVRDFKLSSANEIGKQDGGSAGIAGSAWRGVIKFSGTTDLSNANFANSDYAAQLVYQNYNALIFATGSGSDSGWTFKRPSTAVKIDDINSYGEVIRLTGDRGGLSKDLIKVDDNHKLELSDTKLSKTGEAYVLNSVDDFAKLAITWQTFGYRSMVDGISGGSVGSLASSTINVTEAIDLSGTGLTGLSKDRSDPSNNEGKADGGDERETAHYFSGTLTGKGTISLAIGEPYGTRNGNKIGPDDTSEGNGKIYRHQRLGLFNAVSDGAWIKGVTIGGAMRFENGADIDAGSLAAQVVGTGSVTVSDATFSTSITFDSAKTGKVVNVGGIFGSVADACTLTLGTGAKAQATISNTSNAADIRVGELAGYVAGDKAATINVTGLEVGNSITTRNSGSAKALVGGLVGFIQQGSAKKSVNITDLSYKDFSMTVSLKDDPKNGAPQNGAGGLLGYSWGNAIVTIGGDANSSDSTYALKTSNTSVTADSATEFGGLLYVMSGHLVLQNHALDLSGATLNATSASSFGVLLARGARTADTKTFGADSTPYTGLYLEDKTPWGVAYKVPNGDKKLGVSADKIKYFDEWIADGTRGTGTPNDNDWNAIVSLHTQADTLDMSGDPSEDNSYQNRTEFGKLHHKTNPMTRYYYNLDRCWKEASTAFDSRPYNLSTPEALMIWSVCCYAPPEVYAYIGPSNFDRGNTVVIGGANGSSNTIDLTGYSYYPTNNTCKIDIKNTKITFAYSKIKAEQANNKSNASATQHQNMHLSLIRAYSGSSSSTLSVKDVTLAGSTGIAVNDNSSSSGTSVSGALVCRSAYGSDASSVTTISIDGLTLDGLVIDGAVGKDAKGNPKVAPLLINDLPKYITLNVKNLSARNYSKDGSTVTAASSLFGNLGGSSANNTLVNASFSNNVSVPSEKGNTIFTRASFFESFGYGANQSGSANYVFNENEGKTYGAEIDSRGEYANKQLWYYDADGYGDVGGPGLVSDGEITASSTEPKYGNKYLPYVKLGENGKYYHEMKVNQRAANLVVGCGTYSDPYSVRTANELYALTNYINDQNSAVDEWQVTITADQNATCTRRHDNAVTSEITYQYSVATRKWSRTDETSAASATLENDVMHRYLQSAYYSIEPAGDNNEIEVDANSFNGFGSLANPFRGVIVGDLKDPSGDAISTVNIKLADDGSSNKKASLGLIPYSYGSVVRKLKVAYSGGTNQIVYASKDTNSGTPGAFFGGVIGCIMGGDNIIDGVSVSNSSGFPVTGSGSKSYLVPIGGYVGAICGGGVIFRNSDKQTDGLKDWRSDTKDKGGLYDNPYVGRVIDGYAFSEGCKVENGKENYKVNQLDTSDTGCITTGEIENKYYQDLNSKAIQTKVKDAQGLLVLSAIINSGSGAGAANSGYANNEFGTFNGSKAYYGGSQSKSGYKFGNSFYGKVRNAAYSYVGKSSAEAGSDRATSLSDDQLAPGRQNKQACGPLNSLESGETVNSPYLVAKYATDWKTGYVCAAKATGMDLQFVAGTYDMTDYGTGFTGLSGRYYSNACASSYGADRDRIVPLVACINGNDAKLILSSNVKQYSDDDYFLQSWGGLFSAVTFTAAHASTSVDNNGGYIVKDLQFGDESNQSSVSLSCIKGSGTSSSNGISNLGVGMLAGTTANCDSLVSSGKYSNVSIVNSAVESPSMAGGLLGNSGWASRRTDIDNRSTMVDFNSDKTFSSPVRLYNCSYKNLSVKGATRVGGFVAAVGGGHGESPEKSPVELRVTGANVTVGSDSTLEATGANCVTGGIVGLAWSQVGVNANQGDAGSGTYQTAKLSDVAIKNDAATQNDKYSGTGGIVGTAEDGMDISNLEISSSVEPSSENLAVYIGAKKPSKSYKRAGGVAGQIDRTGTYKVSDTTINNMCISAHDSAAGVVGFIAGGMQLGCDGVVIKDCQINGLWSGGIAGAIDTDDDDAGSGNRSVVTVVNSIIRQNNFINENVGGIAGDGRGAFRLSNVLLDRNGFSQAQTKGQGLLIGIVGTDYADNNGQFGGVFASGIDIIPANVEGKTENAVLPDLIRTADAEILKAVNKKSYIAFADYNDKLDKVDGSSLYNDEGGTIASASPYVATNPVAANPKVKASANGEESLFSDGAAMTLGNSSGGKTSVKSTAETIQKEAGKSVAGRYTYANIGGINGKGEYQNTNAYEPKRQSTYNDSNTDTRIEKKTVAANKNFGVLEIPGNDTTTVTNYLNLVTNGGFSDAVRLNPDTKGDSSFVTAKAEMFTLENRDSGTFVRRSDAASLQVVRNGTNNMSFRASTAWDNNQARFTLLTVTFNDGAGHKYKVQVPIVVKRMLEIDFSATYTYGTNYKASAYKELKNHVLTGMGDTMTGYLTWTYNEALGDDSVRYGLDTLLDSGGALKPVEKSIVFDGDQAKGTLPAGTQLTLVDTKHNNRQYTYTVKSEDTTTDSSNSAHAVTTIPLTKFVDSSTPAKSYQEQWLSELMGVTAAQNDNGGWVKMDSSEDASKAVAKVGGAYYRLYKDGEKVDAKKRYKLSMLDENKKSKESTVSEDFFLVVRVPEKASKTVNGVTRTSVSAPGVNTHVNEVRRYDKHVQNDRNNNESTYGIAARYGQTLTDNNQNKEKPADENVVKMTIDGSDTVYKNLKLDVTDTITLGENEYNNNDALYFQLNSSLAKFENDASAGAVGYPSGAKINKLSFYVTVGGTYYKWNGSSWQTVAAETPAVDAKDTVANGGDLSLNLADAAGNPINLRGIRDIAKNNGGPFSIRVKADVELTEPQCQAAIMASQDGLTGYTKPTYRSFLSTHAESLGTSSMTGDNEGKVRYYRPDIGSSTIALIASKKTQLGINVNDLRSADGTIALVGTYDMSKLNGANAKIDKATTLTYTLTLQRRQDDGTYADVPNIGEYVTVRESDHLDTGKVSGSSIVFTDNKGESGFATRDGNSSAFKHRFVVKVNTSVEGSKQFYANYRLVLTANLTGGGVDDTPVNAESISNYPSSDYVTYTITKVKTDGIDPRTN